MLARHNFFLFSIFYLFSHVSAHSEIFCAAPTSPKYDLEKFDSIMNAGAKLSNISNICNIEDKSEKVVRLTIDAMYDGFPDKKYSALQKWNEKKSKISNDFLQNIYGKLRCVVFKSDVINSVNDFTNGTTDFAEFNLKKRVSYQDEVYSHNNCLERKKIWERRREAVKNVSAGFRSSWRNDGTWVLEMRNTSSIDTSFQLKCCQTNNACKTFLFNFQSGESKSLGFLEGWAGNFVSGEYCTAIYDGEEIWNISKK